MSDIRRERVGCSAVSKHILNPCLHVQAVASCGLRRGGSARLVAAQPHAAATAPAPRPPLVVGAKPYALWLAPAASLSRFSRRRGGRRRISRRMSSAVPRVSTPALRRPDHGGRLSVLALVQTGDLSPLALNFYFLCDIKQTELILLVSLLIQ